ncbi:M56 family metallopeptidase [Nonlabens sp.]|uniref:M56 family metallopeptidase n=1 Tax=Nonlabens sp. TaxID=1888209 RepID=UPI003F6A1A1E
MEHFLINSTVCLFVLWLCYKLLLENSSWHELKRWYLLGALILSLSIPFIVVETVIVPIQEMPFVNVYGNNFTTVTPAIQQMTQETEFTVNWFYVGLIFYLIGVVVMLWRFGRNLYVFRIGREDIVRFYKNYQLVLRNQFTIPHSFIKRIFVSREDYETNQVPEVILEHEKAHLDQKHSIDILFIELLLIVFWFNPLLYVIKYSIKLNHEFLADQAVLNQGISTSVYQKLILKQATTGYQKTLANTFTFPIIKKRFHIMKTNSSKTSLLLRSLVIVPIIAVLIVSCGKEKTEYKNTTEDTKSTETIKSEMSGSITSTDGIEYYVKIKDKDEIVYYDLKGNLLKDFDLNSEDIEAFTMFPRKGQKPSSSASPTIALIENSKEELKYFINDYEVTKTEAVQTIKNTGEEGVVIDIDENGKSFIKITMTPEKRKKMPQIGSMKLESGTIVSLSPTLVNPNKHKDNKLYQMKRQIVSVAEMQEKPTQFYIDNEKVINSEIHYLLHDNPDAGISIKNNSDGSKSLFFTSKEEEKSIEQLQEIYSEFFKDDIKSTNQTLQKVNSTSNIDKEFTTDPESQDFYLRRAILMVSLNQNNKPVYQINGKSVNIEAVKDYKAKNEFANINYKEGAQNILNFSDNKGKNMTIKEIQDIAKAMAKNVPE